MLNKLLAISFIVLMMGKLFFRPQLKALQVWFDGAVNAMLIAITLVYLLQGYLLWSQ